jgi:hypothetical protein
MRSSELNSAMTQEHVLLWPYRVHIPQRNGRGLFTELYSGDEVSYVNRNTSYINHKRQTV